MNQDIDHERRHERHLGIIKQLAEDERVNVHTRRKARDLTVEADAEFREREPYNHDATVVLLSGYGTEYRLEVLDRAASKWPSWSPSLHYPSCRGVAGELVTAIEPLDRDLAIVAGRTAADMGIPER